jgi:penicillin-binding protein 1A
MTGKASPKKMATWLRILGWISGIFMTGFLAFAGGLFIAVQTTANALPDYQAMKIKPTGKTIRIHSADGEVIQSLGPAYGEWIPSQNIPKVMKDAIIAVEDRRYDSHYGVDPKSLGRAVYQAWKFRGTGKRLQGASTITQQAARTVFLSQDYDIKRKVKEMVIAMAMERKLDKSQILELYLNRVYFGGGAWGIDAASRKFFGHPATQLTLNEAALLAGLVKAPSDYSPSADQKASNDRMKVVLKVMLETHRAKKNEIADARTKIVQFASEPVPVGNGTRYFTDWVKPQIDALTENSMGIVDVWTTFDPKLQAMADQAVSNGVPKGVQGSLLSLDRDGAIRAMVGGTDYQTSAYNRATQANRQPGSAFKLFVYLTALENGYTPESIVSDAPITIDDWTPKNANGGFSGDVTLRYAFAQSLNTVAARIGRDVGIEKIARTARKYGFVGKINMDPAMVLGTSETHLIDMTRAYATIAAGGVAIAPYGIEKITVNGREIYKHERNVQLLSAPKVVEDMTSLMRGSVEQGTSKAASIGRPVAGKTGTTSSGKDGWFIGFSSGITTGVWVGRDDAKPVADLQGGRAPARIFAEYMKQAVKDKPVDVYPELKIIEKVPAAEENKKATSPDEEYEGDPYEDNEPAPQPVTGTSYSGKSRAVPPA